MTSKAFGLAQLGNAFADGALSNRNKIINGAMTIDQRNAGAAVTPADLQYTLDRWNAGLTQASKFSVQRSTEAPAGFTNSLLVTSLSAFSVASDDLFRVSQHIEGFNVADLGWGTAGAKPATLSFWVRSSLTGTFSGALINSAANRSYPFTFDIGAADTWEQKSITIEGDTTGTWLTTNGIGIRLGFSLGAGSIYSGPAGTWAGAIYTAATGATSVVATSGATFYLTGVQLEAGDTATPFEHRSYGQELALCQRYYFQDGPYSGSFGSGCHYRTDLALYHYRLPIVMRASPTFTVSAASDFRSVANNSTFVGSGLAASFLTSVAARLDLTISGASSGDGTVLEHANGNAKLMFSAEL